MCFRIDATALNVSVDQVTTKEGTTCPFTVGPSLRHNFVRGQHGETPHAISSLLTQNPNVNSSPGRLTAARSAADAPQTRQRDKETGPHKSESGSQIRPDTITCTRKQQQKKHFSFI